MSEWEAFEKHFEYRGDDGKLYVSAVYVPRSTETKPFYKSPH